MLTLVTETLVDGVLTARPPAFTEADAARFARDFFGVTGTAVSAHSERDQAFLIEGDRPSVLKVSNAAEEPGRLDLEALAVQRIAQVDPGIPVPLPWLVPDSDFASTDPAAYRVAMRGDAGTHYVRMYDRLPGGPSVDGSSLNDRSPARLGHDGRPCRSCDARLLASVGSASHALGRPARAASAAAAWRGSRPRGSGTGRNEPWTATSRP